MPDVSQNTMVPLSRIVSAVMIDMYADQANAGTMQLCYHHASRFMNKITQESLRGSYVSKVILPVNKSTNTVTLPHGFKEETFLGIIDSNGMKVPIRINNHLANPNVEEKEDQNICPTCKTNKRVCKELEITETTESVIINGNTYEKTITKKLYPDGKYCIS